MKLLLTGATGLLGRYILEHPAAADHDIVAVARSAHPELATGPRLRYVALPFEQRAEFSTLLRQFTPDWIVHAGGEGNVDKVQADPAAHTPNNLEFPAFLMTEAASLKARWMTFSSNGIYGGDRAPYAEDAPAQPLHAYGRFKAEVDALTRQFPGQWVIFRPTVSYGWNHPFGRANPVTGFLPRLAQGAELRMVDDQFENPLYAGDAAEIFWRSLAKDYHGELNVAGGDARVSRHAWMTAAARAFGFDAAQIRVAKLGDFPNSTLRPRDTCFDIRRLVGELGYSPATVHQGALRMAEDSSRRQRT
jgi:dTDP-4-dehydrorhamnose reductase